jgi:hypothetical protein
LEKIKERGRSKGFLHNKKWKAEEDWVTNQNTHEALISVEIAEAIRNNRQKRHRATPSHAKVT